MYLEGFRYNFLIRTLTLIPNKIRSNVKPHHGTKIMLPGKLSDGHLRKLVLPFAGRSIYISPLRKWPFWEAVECLKSDHPYEIMTSHLPFRSFRQLIMFNPTHQMTGNKQPKTLQGFVIHNKKESSVWSHALDYHFLHSDDIGLLNNDVIKVGSWSQFVSNLIVKWVILLMAEILHHLKCMKPCK